MICPIEFKEIYQSGNYEDPHGEYAKRHGISRNEAKNRAFMQLYSEPSFGTGRKQSMGETFKHLYGNRGLTTSNFDTSFVDVYLEKQRQENVGYISLEVDFTEIERKLMEYSKGAAAGKEYRYV